MAESPFPVFRLVTLLARQASAPLATRIKVGSATPGAWSVRCGHVVTYARSHPRFRRRVCMATGRAYSALELRAKLWMLALRQPRSLPPLSDDKALDAGADILGEAVLFFLGALILIFELNRQAKIQEYKEQDELSQWMAVLAQLEELQHELEQQQQDIDRLMATLRQLAPQHFRDEPTATTNESLS